MGAIVLANIEGGVGMPLAIEEATKRSPALDIVEKGIREVERDTTVRTVGFGGAPNILGHMECDAAMMCGASLRCGAVGALRDYLYAISVARQVMEQTPHTMLVGEGAALFAAEIGHPRSDILDAQARLDYEAWIAQHIPQDVLLRWPDVPLREHVWRSANPQPHAEQRAFWFAPTTVTLRGEPAVQGGHISIRVD